MARAGAIRAGAAFVELYADGSRLQKDLSAAQRRFQTWGQNLTRVGAGLFAGGASIGGPLALAVKAASDEQETYNKFVQVFGENAQRAEAWVDELAKTVGRSKTQMRDALSTLQAFFVGLGFTRDESQELSQTLTALAIDFGSFFNIGDDEALRRFISALAGSPEVLDKFGVNIREAALEQEAMRRGMDVNIHTADEMTKSLLRVGVLLRTMTDQGLVGDAVRTAGQFANLWKRLKGEIRDTGAAIGRSLLPVLEPVVAVAAEGVEVIGDVVQRFPGLVVGLAAASGLALAAGAALTLLGIAAFGVGSGFGAIASAAGLLLTPVGAVSALTIAGAAAFVTWSGAGASAVRVLREEWSTLGPVFQASISAMMDALSAGDAKLAVEIFWATFRVAWLEGQDSISKLWNDWIDSLGDKWEALKKAIVDFDAGSLAQAIPGVRMSNAARGAIADGVGLVAADAQARAESSIGPLGERRRQIELGEAMREREAAQEQVNMLTSALLMGDALRARGSAVRPATEISAELEKAQERLMRAVERIAQVRSSSASALADEKANERIADILDRPNDPNAADEQSPGGALAEARKELERLLEQSENRSGSTSGLVSGNSSNGSMSTGLELNALFDRLDSFASGGLRAMGTFGSSRELQGGREFSRDARETRDNTKRTADGIEKLNRMIEQSGGLIFV
jgi:hypothetical protein